MIIPATMIPDSGKEMAMAIPSLLASLIAVAIWTAYLNRSKRVKNTYGLSDELPIAQVPTRAHEVSSTNNLATTGLGQHMSPHSQNGYANKIIPDADYPATVDEDRVYCQIAEELEIGAIDKGGWTRLFAESGGDEKQTKVSSVRLIHTASAVKPTLKRALRDSWVSTI